MIERIENLTTPEGEMTTFIYHPDSDGPHPVVLYLMDAPSIRPALMDMASRLATAGYYVMMPYLFYRGGPYREFGESDPEMHQRRELMGSVTPTNILSDASALLDWAQADPAARNGTFGAVGFCMSGGLVMAIAKQWGDQCGGVASIHGAWLVRDSEDSPHLGLDRASASMYFGWADRDETAPVEDRDVLEAALAEAGIDYRLDFFTDAVHGYAPAGPRYNRAASERHWEQVHSLLRRRVD